MSPATPIILFTAKIALEAKRKAQDLGIAGFINKPFEGGVSALDTVIPHPADWQYGKATDIHS